MKKALLLLISVTILILGCGTVATIYNTDNYSDSLIIKSFEQSGVNPEAFSKRALRAIKAEIEAGKFTKDQAVEFINIYVNMLDSGTASYDLVADVVDKYAREFFLSDNASEVAIIAYYMLMPDLPTLQVNAPIGPQDEAVARDFLQYLIANL